MSSARLAWSLLAALLLAACSGAPVRARPAMLRVIAEPASTAVYVDDQFVGTGQMLARRPKRMAPGVKFVTFQAADYFPHDLRLDLPEGETTVRIKLRPIPR